MKAIILHNMGGARSEKELKEFLYNIFMDKRIISSPARYFLAPLISNLRYKRVWKNYEKIGGSRIYKITESLTQKMQNLTTDKVKYAMRYTKPHLKETIHTFKEITLLPLYPHYSFSTYESSIDELKKTKYKGKVHIVKPFYKNKNFNKIIKENILNSIDNPKKWNLIFSAHGLPKEMIEKGDKYYDNVKEHIEILKNILPEFKTLNLAFQSRFGYKQWLKPYLQEELTKYKNENVLIYPISFMIDNSETDLELKIQYGTLAKKIGIKNYKVISCPNDNESTVKFLMEMAYESNKQKNVL